MVCCVTGHRPKGFPFPRKLNDPYFTNYINILQKIIYRLIREGYEDFITGMASGADMDFADTVLNYRDAGEYISLEAALPCPMQPSRKLTNYKIINYMLERNTILHQCDKEVVISPHYHKGCMQKRNEYMVDKSDLVLAIWNGEEHGGTWNTIKYARSKGKKIHYIMLKDISKDIEEYIEEFIEEEFIEEERENFGF